MEDKVEIAAFTFDKNVKPQELANELRLKIVVKFGNNYLFIGKRMVSPIFWSFVRIPRKLIRIIKRAQSSPLLKWHCYVN